MTDLERAVTAIRAGEIVGLPTDTVYGLGVDPHDPSAVQRLFRLKGREANVPLVVLTASLAEASEVGEMTPRARADVDAHWPGALTVVVHSVAVLAPGVGDPVTGTIGVRVPDSPVCRRVLSETGPLAVTSANLSGADPAESADDAQRQFGEAVAVYVPGACPGGRSSTVVDYTREPPVLLRAGPVEV